MHLPHRSQRNIFRANDPFDAEKPIERGGQRGPARSSCEKRLKISGTCVLAMPPEKAYESMQDPAVLARCMPGCEALEKIGGDEYKMKMAVPSLLSAFDGKVMITDQNPPSSFRILVEGNGKNRAL